MLRSVLPDLWRRELSGYTLQTFRHDLLAGVTVGAVALPLALAFGVASGATAAAGLVTAIIAGLVIGALSGAPYQVSGPTGAMSAVLIVVATRHGLEGMWTTSLLAGALILLVGLLRMGRFISFIPSPVITGFTSGIALIIAIGQVDALLGVPAPAAETAAGKLLVYLREGLRADPSTLAIGALVMAIMIAWPARWARYAPGSLAGIAVATVAAALFAPSIGTIGEIPASLLLEDRLRLANVPWDRLGDLLAPAFSVAALGAVESLLCGAVAAKMTGIRLHANEELVAQGVGNILIPLFGGVPATAAIARTSVAIRAGGRTRVTSIVHALTLLAAALALGPVLSRVPLAALAGVLMVTAWRMNEWPAIRFLFGHRFKAGIAAYLVTLVATVTLDLTQAILIGGALSAAIFLNEAASIHVDVRAVDPERMRARGFVFEGHCPHVQVAYLTGPLFFAATGNFNESMTELPADTSTLILSMRAVPTIDLSGVEALAELHHRFRAQGKAMMLAGLQPQVEHMLERGGLLEELGRDQVFWSADRAILAAEERGECFACDAA